MAKKGETGKIVAPSNEFRSGFVAIVGAPNVGKSTLLNFMIGQKVSITSRKPQTTRNRILGVLTKTLAQFVFIDTPGLHKATGSLNTKIVQVAITAIKNVDLILLVIDGSNSNFEPEEISVLDLLVLGKPVILAINKIDKIKEARLFNIINFWATVYQFDAVIPISAITGKRVKFLVDNIQKFLPIALPMFPPETITDMSVSFIVSEMIREKVFRLTGEEVPYSVAVSIDNFEEGRVSYVVRIHATIHVERNSQKGIIIGKNGEKLKKIGKAARFDIQRLLNSKIFLKLFVRVQKNWSKDSKTLKKFGY